MTRCGTCSPISGCRSTGSSSAGTGWKNCSATSAAKRLPTRRREPPMSADSAGVIHNIGYRAYQGQRLGRPEIVRALTWYSLRAAFGFGRGAKAKIVPVLTFVVMCAPAVISAVVTALGASHARPITYDVYVAPLRILVLIVFMAAQAPDLVSRDLRSHTLPLYF